MYEVGTVLAGKYRVDRLLGRGGMGMVVAATHLQLARPVALKFVLGEWSNHEVLIERFLREARACAKLQDEHVCKVHDVGTLEDGAPYIVMELLEGRDLASRVAHQGPLDVPTAAGYVLQACIALAEAHSVGIVHRDLKPANLFVARRPDGTDIVKVLDFGIAKVQDNVSQGLTATMSVMGSPGYMSPEQLRSAKGVDARSDIWGLGVILYELVSAQRPFEAQTITEMAVKVAVDPTPPIPVRVPPAFERLVQQCLSKSPDARFKDVAALANALASFARPEDRALATSVSRILRGASRAVALAETVGDEPAPFVPAVQTTLGEAAGAVTEAAKRSRVRPVLIVAGAMGIGALVTAVVLSGTGRGSSTSTAGAGSGSTEAIAPAATVDASPAGTQTPDAASQADAALADAPGPAKDAAQPAVDAGTKRDPKQPKRPARSPSGSAQEDFGENRF
jgi:serine/threonine-protein kinase